MNLESGGILHRVMNQLGKGLTWVALAGLTFVIFTTIVRYVGNELHPVQAAFIRYALGLFVLAPLFLRNRLGLFGTRRLGRHAIRGFVHGIGVMLWFFAAARLPIAEVTALSFISPIFVAIGAVLFLGERMSAPRMIAIALGFAGVLIILRPGISAIGAGIIALLFAAPLFAISKLLTKTLVREDSSGTVVAYLSIFATLTMAVPALFVWQPPSGVDLFFLAGTAVFATLSHLCMAQGLALIDVTVSQPVEFLQLVWATLIGLALFNESPTLWIWLGAGVIVFSATYIAHYEANVRATLTGTPR